MQEWGLPTRVEYEEASGHVTQYTSPLPFSHSNNDRPHKGGYVEATEKGIKFYFPNLYSDSLIRYISTRKNNPEKDYVSMRLMEPQGHMKYRNPGDIDKKTRQRGTYPFITPRVLDAYAQGIEFTNLFIIEGPAKALKADLEGLFAIGLQGKDNFTDTTTGKLHKEITDVLHKCKVKNLIYLQDGDAREVKYDENKDLADRPKSFFAAVKRFKSRCLPLMKTQGLNVYFMHGREEYPKGLDDLFVKLMADSEEPKAAAKEIIEDLYQLDKARQYFYGFRLNAKSALKSLKEHFCLHDVKIFYERHVMDRAPYEPFIWQADTYQCHEETDEVELIKSRWANNYFAVGSEFYLLEQVRERRSGKIELMRTPWNKGLIAQRHIHTKKEDHWCPLIFDQIQYYSRWFFEPDHFNYRAEDFIPGNDFPQLNRYHDVGWQVDPHEKSEKEWAAGCPTIRTFVSHIFQNDDKIEEGLDWLRLLYEQPRQKLHCLCLVSEENETGKSTFGKLLKEIYKQNCLIAGNQEISSQFNAIYADRLVLVVDEAEVEPAVKEKIKMLTTMNKIPVNDKNTKVAEIDYYGHIVLITNKELDFMNITEHDNRFFVIKVPNFEQSRYRVNVPDGKELIDMMVPEVRDFIGYLLTRKMKHPAKNNNRFWLPYSAIRTAALARVVEYSKSDLDMEFGELVRQVFNVYQLEEHFYVELKTLVALLNENRDRKHERTDIMRFLRKRFPGIQTEPPSLYNLFEGFDEETGEVLERRKDCRPYKFSRADFAYLDA